MKKVLCILASPMEERSISRTLAWELLDRFREGDPELAITVRDLAAEPLPHWGANQTYAAFTPIDQRDVAQREAIELSDRLCEELLGADVLVIASPMWNFGVPSVLKSWVDHVVRGGLTFQITGAGPVGKVTQLESAYVIEAMGGRIEPGQPTRNHVAPYLCQILEYLGASDIRVVSAQGTVVDPERALREGRQAIREYLDRTSSLTPKGNSREGQAFWRHTDETQDSISEAAAAT